MEMVGLTPWADEERFIMEGTLLSTGGMAARNVDEKSFLTLMKSLLWCIICFVFFSRTQSATKGYALLVLIVEGCLNSLCFCWFGDDERRVEKIRNRSKSIAMAVTRILD